MTRYKFVKKYNWLLVYVADVVSSTTLSKTILNRFLRQSATTTWLDINLSKSTIDCLSTWRMLCQAQPSTLRIQAHKNF